MGPPALICVRSSKRHMICHQMSSWAVPAVQVSADCSHRHNQKSQQSITYNISGCWWQHHVLKPPPVKRNGLHWAVLCVCCQQCYPRTRLCRAGCIASTTVKTFHSTTAQAMNSHLQQIKSGAANMRCCAGTTNTGTPQNVPGCLQCCSRFTAAAASDWLTHDRIHQHCTRMTHHQCTCTCAEADATA